MRSLGLAVVASLLAAAQASSQVTIRESTGRGGLPRDVAREASRLFNETAAIRSTERLVIDEERTVDGDVAVLNGPLLISGRVRGRVLAINSDVVLRPSARIDGDLLVVGGEVEGRHSAYIGGEIRIYRQHMQYSRDGERITPDRLAPADEEEWWRRWERPRPRSGSKLQVASAGAYNRVEGLPINLGPQIFWNDFWGSWRLDAYAVLRTETSFGGTKDDVGHNVNAEVRLGKVGGLLLGGRAFSLVDPTETWQLSELEAGLAAFVARRDYRDYYERHGGHVRAGLFLRRGADVSAAFGQESWVARPEQTPWTLTRRSVSWRPNPFYDEGKLRMMNATLRVDTRNDRRSPWSGWYVLTDIERGYGDITAYAPRSAPLAAATPGSIDYTRGFADIRRYNRISPGAQLNMRVVLGGWLNGDPLPLQRRFSADGPGAMPGYDFRSTTGVNELTCTTGAYAAGVPGQCDRIALTQVEYRGDLHFDLFTDWDSDYTRGASSGVWVFFADAGRGWLVGNPTDTLSVERNKLPKLATFKTDLGLGLDFEWLGIFAAKPMTAPRGPINFFLRIRHRF